MARTKPWQVSEEFREKVRPLIPPAPSHAKGGRGPGWTTAMPSPP